MERMERMERSVKEPWFSLIAVGAKRFEGRLGNNASLSPEALPPGSTIRWVNDELGFRRAAETTVVGTTRHASFRAMFRAVGLRNALPTVPRTEDGEAVYRRFYSAEDEAKHGVLCIELLLTEGRPSGTGTSGSKAGRSPSGIPGVRRASKKKG
jgi:ASC-1-like (ASCH) protein